MRLQAEEINLLRTQSETVVGTYTRVSEARERELSLLRRERERYKREVDRIREVIEEVQNSLKGKHKHAEASISLQEIEEEQDHNDTAQELL